MGTLRKRAWLPYPYTPIGSANWSRPRGTKMVRWEKRPDGTHARVYWITFQNAMWSRRLEGLRTTIDDKGGTDG